MAERRIRSSAVFASIWTTIQGVIYLVFSIFAVQTFQCQLELGQNNILIYVLNLIYFHNAECHGEINLGDLDTGVDILKNLTITTTPATASRTYTWMLVTLILSSLWIATSLLLFFGAVCDAVRGVLYLTVVPWTLVTAATLVADVVATITYATDVQDTSTFQELLELLGVNIPDGGGFVDVPELIDSIEIVGTWVPSVVMCLFFSRCILFWIVNLFLLIFVFMRAYRRNRLVHAQQWDDKPSGPPSENRQTFQSDYRQGPPFQARVDRPIFQPSPGFQSPPAFQPAAVQGRPQSVDRLNSMYDTPVSSVSDLYSLPLDPMTENWLARHRGDGSQDEPSNLKKVYDERVGNQLATGPEELRGQLPWSYVHDRQSAQPRPADARHHTAGDRPPVPVPDYTLHFPKRRGESEGRTPKSSAYSIDPGMNRGPSRPVR